MATYQKTVSGKWKVQVRRRGHPASVRTFGKKVDAERWAISIEASMSHGALGTNGGPSAGAGAGALFGALLDRYLAEVTPRKKSRPGKEISLAIPLRAYFGQLPVRTITKETVGAYRDTRLATVSPKTGATLQAATVRREVSLLSTVITTAMEEWEVPLPKNPVRGVYLPPARTRAKRLPADLLRLREKRAPLLDACRRYRNPKLAWIVELALETMMRKSEISGIQKSWLDLASRTLSLPDTKAGCQREVPLTLRGCEILQEALAAASKGPYVFPNRNATGPWAVDKAWRTARSRARVDPLHFHDLRHEAISVATENGAPAQIAASIAGHTVRTQQRYVTLDGKSLVLWIDKLMPRSAPLTTVRHLALKSAPNAPGAFEKILHQTQAANDDVMTSAGANA
jgi:integrase